MKTGDIVLVVLVLGVIAFIVYKAKSSPSAPAPTLSQEIGLDPTETITGDFDTGVDTILDFFGIPTPW